MSNRLDNTRVVTFSEDFLIKGRTSPLYVKGREYAIHHKVVKQLEEKGAKLKAKHFDEKGEIAKLKEDFEKSKESGK